MWDACIPSVPGAANFVELRPSSPPADPGDSAPPSARRRCALPPPPAPDGPWWDTGRLT
eukprot:gene24132-44907_t